MLSIPVFKHTSYNLIIDLFVFNNKSFNYKKYENMLSRRILYKYMYSMYFDVSNKIMETLNRPRFFYINLIEPKIYNYYSNILNAYENLLVRRNKTNFIYFCLLILKFNNLRKYNLDNLKNKYILFKLEKYT